jgi:hypothetical protein
MFVNGLQHNLLDLIERDFIIPPIVKLRRARTLMRRHLLRVHLLRVLEQAAVLQVDRDAGRAERVAAKLRLRIDINK